MIRTPVDLLSKYKDKSPPYDLRGKRYLKKISEFLFREKKKHSKDITKGFKAKTCLSVVPLCILEKYSQIPDSNWAYCFV